MQEGSYKTVNKAVKSDNSETTVVNGPCWLDGIVINSNGTTNLLEIKDDTTVLITGTLAASPLPHFCHIGCNIETSLKIELSGGAAGNILVIYRT